MESTTFHNLFITVDSHTILAAKLWLPQSNIEDTFPTILEYIPYGKSLGTYERDFTNHGFFSSHGYVCLRVDLRGSGESNGQLEDEYLNLINELDQLVLD